MKRLFVFLFMIGISGQAIIRTAWTVHYQWNQAVYLENCTNKNKPELLCSGKCLLEKNIAVGEQKPTEAPSLPAGFRQAKDMPLFFEPYPALLTVEIPVLLKSESPGFAIRRPEEAPRFGIFKPPTV